MGILHPQSHAYIFNGLEIIISFYTASLLLIYGIGGVESFKTQKDRQDLS